MSHAERRHHLKEILTRSSVRSSLPLNSRCLPANVLKQTRDPAALVRAAVSVMKLFECHCSHSKVLLSLTREKVQVLQDWHGYCLLPGVIADACLDVPYRVLFLQSHTK